MLNHYHALCLQPFSLHLANNHEAFEGGSSFPTNVGAILLFFGAVVSSFSDSLVSLFPRTLPVTELGLLLAIPDIGVCGGVVHGKLLKVGFVVATLGTLPNVGVGLLTI